MNFPLRAMLPMILFAVLTLTSCQKEIEDLGNPNPVDPPTGVLLEAKIDGKRVVFEKVQATLLRSIRDNQKRLDIAGISADGKKSLILTLGDKPATGNGVTLKDYVINLFNEDDPNTAVDESEGNDDGFVTISESLGNASWVTDVYAQTGIMKVSSCDVQVKKVTGTFSVKATSLTSGTVIHITEGKFTNIPYQVLN